LAEHLDHQWILGRRTRWPRPSCGLIARPSERATKPVQQVVCHRDVGGLNLILDDNDEVAAILDWEQAVLGPREHNLWIAAEGGHLESFLTEYGVWDLDIDHIAYVLLARALGDMAARVLGEAPPVRRRRPSERCRSGRGRRNPLACVRDQ
jgi:hypothetical protein